MYVLDTYAIIDDIVSTFAAESRESNVTVARTCVHNNRIQIVCGTVSFVLATNCIGSLILFSKQTMSGLLIGNYDKFSRS